MAIMAGAPDDKAREAAEETSSASTIGWRKWKRGR